MDLYTTAARIRGETRLNGDPLELGQHGIIGDGFSCALVGIDGSIDWLCLPRFDSPSVFGSILDREKGGSFRVSPSRRPCESLQAYDPDTNVLQTLFRVEDHGVFTLSDFMPWVDGARESVHQVHRMLAGLEGSVDIEILFDPRFNYGRDPARIELVENGVMARGPNGEQLALAIADYAKFEVLPSGGARACFTLRAGQRLWTILDWNTAGPDPIAAYRSFDHLRATRRYWRGWSSKLVYDGPWRHEVLRSALTLKLLQYVPTGAIVAAPTTSLPETLGGSRNWDYRYSWTRDSAMAIRATSLIGYTDEARGFFHFVRNTLDQRGHLDIMVTIDGQEVPDEISLDHLSGYANSKPVRLGNAAHNQIQHDIGGVLLDAVYTYEHSGGTISLRLWRHIRNLVNRVIACRNEPDHGIWEPRAEPVHHTHSKLMAWVALDRALRIAPLFGGDPLTVTWHREREALRKEILERGYRTNLGTFIGTYDQDHLDATSLLLPLYGFLPISDPRIERTLNRVAQDLKAGRYLYRYQNGDGLDGKEGAFYLCGFWLCEALALSGRIDEALEVFHNHVTSGNHLGLLAEEVDPASGKPLGNFPQAFSHLGLIQAAARLDRALRLRDEGTAKPPFHAFDLPDQD